MVVASAAPLLLLDGEQKIIAVSASFCRDFDIAPASVPGRQLFELGAGEWDVRQLRSLMNATASGDAEIDAYEMDLKRPGRPSRRLVLNVQKLAFDHPQWMRLLVSVTDVTDARLIAEKNKDLVRENELLLQEVRHRVANSLQIIASVLMQNARRAQSEETRNHLRDAHQRVMAVADLQQQLAASTLGTVELRAYLTKLCETIGASMIYDPGQMSLDVEVEDVVIDAGVSVSLGLIVTELVINALKHGFPDGAGGKITVRYKTGETSWTLSVTDTGIGMPKVLTAAPSGLGTSIVQALARQLHANIQVDDMNPGARVSVIHTAVLPEAIAAE